MTSTTPTRNYSAAASDLKHRAASHVVTYPVEFCHPVRSLDSNNKEFITYVPNDREHRREWLKANKRVIPEKKYKQKSDTRPVKAKPEDRDFDAEFTALMAETSAPVKAKAPEPVAAQKPKPSRVQRPTVAKPKPEKAVAVKAPAVTKPGAGQFQPEPPMPVVNLNTGAYFDSCQQAAEVMGVTTRSVKRAAEGTTALCKGYKFRVATPKEQASKQLVGALESKPEKGAYTLRQERNQSRMVAIVNLNTWAYYKSIQIAAKALYGGVTALRQALNRSDQTYLGYKIRRATPEEKAARRFLGEIEARVIPINISLAIYHEPTNTVYPSRAQAAKGIPLSHITINKYIHQPVNPYGIRPATEQEVQRYHQSNLSA